MKQKSIEKLAIWADQHPWFSEPVIALIMAAADKHPIRSLFAMTRMGAILLQDDTYKETFPDKYAFLPCTRVVALFMAFLITLSQFTTGVAFAETMDIKDSTKDSGYRLQSTNDTPILISRADGSYEQYMVLGSTLQLNAVVSPEFEGQKTVWTSDDSDVLIVNSDGLVTAKKVGSATVTVEIENSDLEDSISLTVLKQELLSADQDLETNKVQKGQLFSDGMYLKEDGTLWDCREDEVYKTNKNIKKYVSESIYPLLVNSRFVSYGKAYYDGGIYVYDQENGVQNIPHAVDANVLYALFADGTLKDIRGGYTDSSNSDPIKKPDHEILIDNVEKWGMMYDWRRVSYNGTDYMDGSEINSCLAFTAVLKSDKSLWIKDEDNVNHDFYKIADQVKDFSTAGYLTEDGDYSILRRSRASGEIIKVRIDSNVERLIDWYYIKDNKTYGVSGLFDEKNYEPLEEWGSFERDDKPINSCITILESESGISSNSSFNLIVDSESTLYINGRKMSDVGNFGSYPDCFSNDKNFIKDYCLNYIGKDKIIYSTEYVGYKKCQDSIKSYSKDAFLSRYQNRYYIDTNGYFHYQLNPSTNNSLNTIPLIDRKVLSSCVDFSVGSNDSFFLLRKDGTVWSCSEKGYRLEKLTLNHNDIASIMIYGPSSMPIGTTAQFTVKILPEDAENKEVSWYSEDTDIAEVDENGLVTAKSEGETMICVETDEGNHQAEKKLIVKNGPQPTTHTITATAKDGGTISPSGAVSIKEGAEQIFTITPYSGYKISGVLVDGKEQGAVSTYTFSSVKKSHTIEARFIPADHYVLTVQNGSGSGEYKAGTKVAIKANPSSKKFTNWTTTGSGTFADENSSSTTFVMPEADAVVRANYKSTSSSNDEDSDNTATQSKPETPIAQPGNPVPATSFRLDTSSYSFSSGQTYYFLVKSTSEVVPVCASSNPAAVSIAYCKKTPEGYLFAINGLANGEAVITAQIGNEVASFPVQVAAGAVASDTPSSMNVKPGQPYTFLFTVDERKKNLIPTFTVGDGTVLKTQLIRKDGNRYYLRVYATGASGSKTGVYSTMPGEQPTLQCAITVE